MNSSKSLRNTFLVILLSLIISACATKKTTTKIDGQMQSDVYTGTDTVKYLAEGVPDRVFFATNESILTTASRDTLRKQANWLRENSSINVVVEGHADERGTREYNLALGARRANSAREFLVSRGIESSRIRTVSFGKERPAELCSREKCYSKNRRAVSVVSNLNF